MPGSEAIILAAIVAFFAFFFTRMDKKMDKRDKAAEVRETVREKRAEERTEKLVKCRDLELSYMIAAGVLQSILRNACKAARSVRHVIQTIQTTLLLRQKNIFLIESMTLRSSTEPALQKTI